MNRTPALNSGFSLIELLVAAAIFTFVVSSVSSLFISALDLQRRATGIQKIEENAQFALEAVAREVRVSRIVSGDTNCTPVDPVSTRTLRIEHPVNGPVVYQYVEVGGRGSLTRNDVAVTSSDVNLSRFAFCVSGSSTDGVQSRVTIPMTIEALNGRRSNQVSVSLQTTVISRDLSDEITP